MEPLKYFFNINYPITWFINWVITRLTAPQPDLLHHNLLLSTYYFITLPRYKPELSFRFYREGKSGQRRATHRLIAGFPVLTGKEKVPQKITTHDENRGKR